MAVVMGDQTDQALTGTNDNDTIEGGGGNDTIFGGAGDDFIQGTDFNIEGSADVQAGSGNDEISLTSYGDATVHGGAGNDILALYWSTVSTNSVTVSIASPNSTADLGNGITVKFQSIEQLRIHSGDGDDHITGGDLSD